MIEYPSVCIKGLPFLVDPNNWDRDELLEVIDVEATENFWKRVNKISYDRIHTTIRPST